MVSLVFYWDFFCFSALWLAFSKCCCTEWNIIYYFNCKWDKQYVLQLQRFPSLKKMLLFWIDSGYISWCLKKCPLVKTSRKIAVRENASHENSSPGKCPLQICWTSFSLLLTFVWHLTVVHFFSFFIETIFRGVFKTAWDSYDGSP